MLITTIEKRWSFTFLFQNFLLLRIVTCWKTHGFLPLLKLQEEKERVKLAQDKR